VVDKGKRRLKAVGRLAARLLRDGWVECGF